MSVNSACIVLFVGFSDDRWIEFFRFGVVVFLLLGIIIIVGVSRRHSVAYDGDEAPADRPFSGKRGVMSASCWILRHLRTDVSAQAGVGNIPILHSKLSKCR